MRQRALEKIKKDENQDLIKSLLERETESEIIQLATEKLEVQLSNISLMCNVASYRKTAENVVGYLVQMLEQPCIER